MFNRFVDWTHNGGMRSCLSSLQLQSMSRWVWRLCKWPMFVLGLFAVGCVESPKVTMSEEKFMIGQTKCDFSFTTNGDWALDPMSETYANIPVLVPKSEIASPRVFLSMNRFWRDDKSPGGWFVVTKDKCQLATRDMIQTRDGKEAKVFLASSCDVSEAMQNGQLKSPFQGHTLYGYVVVNDTEADFFYLSSSDPAVLRRHEGVLHSALRSYSTDSPACVARRTAFKNLEFTGGPAPSAHSEDTGTRAPASRIDPQFVQNLNMQLSSIKARDGVSTMAFDSRNDFFLVGRKSGAIDIWDGRQANSRTEVKAPEAPRRLTFSSDGRVFFSNYHVHDGTHVWDTASGSIIHTIERSRGPVVQTSEPNLFVLGTANGLRIFDLTSGELLPGTFGQVGDVVTAMAYDAPTDQLGIGTASGDVEVWKLTKSPTPALNRVAAAVPYATGNWVRGIQFFNNGRSLYSLPERGNLDEWSTGTLERLRSRDVSLGFVGATVFIPEEARLAMVGFRKGDTQEFDNVLEILNLESGSRNLIDLKEKGTGSIVYLPSMSTIVSGNRATISVVDIGKAR